MPNSDVCERAREYIREQLRHGLGLGRIVRDTIDLSHGTVTTVMPPIYGTSLLDHFDWGRRDELLEYNTEMMLVEKLVDYLSESAERLLICEDLLPSPTFPAFEDKRDVAWLFGDDIYCCASSSTGQAIGEEQVLRVIREASSVMYNTGFLSVVAPGMSTANAARSLTENDLTHIADQTRAIFVQAYDGEGYLLWEAQDP